MCRASRRTHRRRCGATLIELVVVLVISSILAGGIAVFLAEPFRGYRDMARRARLVDEAESALRRMARDVRRALPNSVRVAGSGTALELLYVADGAQYRRRPGGGHTGAPAWLTFAAVGDDEWNVLGTFDALAFSYGTPLPAGTRIAIYPTSSGVYDDARNNENPGVITPDTRQITIVADGNEDRIQLDANHTFSFESPEQRLFVVEGPVSYLCDTGAATLTRYDAYPIETAQPTDPTATPLDTAADALLARRVTACAFTYQPGTSQRQALLTMELTLAEANESVRLLHQVHVENTP